MPHNTTSPTKTNSQTGFYRLFCKQLQKALKQRSEFVEKFHSRYGAKKPALQRQCGYILFAIC